MSEETRALVILTLSFMAGILMAWGLDGLGRDIYRWWRRGPGDRRRDKRYRHIEEFFDNEQ